MIHKYLNATVDMLLFRSVTFLPRWMEIAFGILGWGNIAVIVIALLKLSE